MEKSRGWRIRGIFPAVWSFHTSFWGNEKYNEIIRIW